MVNGNIVTGNTYSRTPSVVTTYTLTFDGTFFRHYLNGNMIVRPYPSVNPGPLIVTVNMSGGVNAGSPMSIVYIPLAAGFTGDTGPTGQLGMTGPLGTTLQYVYTSSVIPEASSGNYNMLATTGTNTSYIYSSTAINGPFTLTFTITKAFSSYATNVTLGIATNTTQTGNSSFSTLQGIFLNNLAGVNPTVISNNGTQTTPSPAVNFNMGVVNQTYQIAFDGSSIYHYVNGILAGPIITANIPPRPWFVCAWMNGPQNFGSININYQPVPTPGRTGPIGNSLQYTYGNGVTVDQSTGRFILSSSLSTTSASGGIVSINQVDGSFSLTFSFGPTSNIMNSNGQAWFGLTSSTNFITPTSQITTSDKLTHGLVNWNGAFWIFNNSTNGTPATGTTNIQLNQGNLFTGLTGSVLYTYTLSYDGTYITHYMNGKQIGTSYPYTFTVPMYIYANVVSGIQGPLEINYSRTTAGTTGPTGLTGPAIGPLNYKYTNITMNTSDGSFGLSQNASLYSTTPIIGQFSITFVLNNVTDTSVDQIFGVSRTPAPTNPDHGINVSTAGNATKGKMYINGPTAIAGDIGTVPYNVTTGQVQYTITYINQYITHYINGVLYVNNALYTDTPIADTQTGPFYIYASVAKGISSIQINYSSLGQIGPTGPPANNVVYNYGSAIKFDKSSGNFIVPAVIGTKIPTIVSINPVTGPFSLMFTFPSCNAGIQMLGLTTNSNVYTTAIPLAISNLTYGVYNNNGTYSAYNNGAVTTPAQSGASFGSTMNTYNMQYDGTNIIHYVNGIRILAPIKVIFTAPQYIFAYVQSGFTGPITISFNTTPPMTGPTGDFGPTGPSGPTGPIANNILYNYGNAITFDRSSGNFIVPADAQITGKNPAISSTNQITGPFSLMFTFQYANTGTQAFGLTTNVNAYTGSAVISNSNLTYGLWNNNGTYWVCNNNTNGSPSAGAMNIATSPTTGIFVSGTNTYNIQYDGTFMIHYVNGNRIAAPVRVAITAPQYIYVNPQSGAAGPVTINFNTTPAVTGPTGDTGATGPMIGPLNYVVNGPIVRPSDGSFIYQTGVTDSLIYSRTPITGPFTVTFILNNVTLPTGVEQTFGVTNNANPGNNAILSHGISHKPSFNPNGCIDVNGTHIKNTAATIWDVATEVKYTLAFDGLNFTHYVNGVMCAYTNGNVLMNNAPIQMPYQNTLTGPFYIYAYVRLKSIDSLVINYSPVAPIGPTGLPANNILYKFGNAITIDKSTGNFIIPSPMPTNKNPVIVSINPVTGPFSLMFTFQFSSDNRQMFGLTQQPTNIDILTSLIDVTKLSYGLYNYNGQFWIYNNNTGAEPSTPSATQFRPTQTTGLFVGGTNTYNMQYDGNVIIHYVNGNRIAAPIKVTFTQPVYIFANAHAGISGPLTINFNTTPAVTGPTGDTGVTGPMIGPLNYFVSGPIINPSDGAFIYQTGVTDSLIYSRTPITGPFTVTFILNNVTSTSAPQIFGVTNNASPTSNMAAISHGITGQTISGTVSLWRSKGAMYINNFRISNSRDPIPWGTGTTQYTLTFDGLKFTHYINGVMYTNFNADVTAGNIESNTDIPMPYDNTLTGPFYIYAYTQGKVMDSLIINYSPVGPIGPTGPLANNILYNYGNAIKFDKSTGNFIVPSPMPASKNPAIVSINPVTGPFSLMFTFPTANSGYQMFGLTADSSVYTGTALIDIAKLTYGIYNNNGTYVVYNNSAVTTPAQSGASFGLAMNTYNMQYDGTFITHYMNGIRILAPIRTAITTAQYIFANARSVLAGPITINFNTTPAGTGPTGMTGPATYSTMNYAYSSNIETDPSTGNFNISDTDGATAICSTTPITGPFILTFTITRAYTGNLRMVTFGVTNIINGNDVNNGNNLITNGVSLTGGNFVPIIHGIYENGSVPSNIVRNRDRKVVGGEGALAITTKPDTKINGTTYQIEYDGINITAYVNGALCTNTPYMNTVPLPWYIVAGFNGVNGQLNIKYMPMVKPFTGPTGLPANNILYNFGNAITLDKSTGDFILSLSPPANKNPAIVSMNEVAGAFSLTFTFTVTNSSRQMFGLTRDRNVYTGTALMGADKLAYGVYSYNDAYWIFNNNSTAEQSTNQATSTATQFKMPSPNSNIFPAGTITTYNMLYDGTFITHYVNGKQLMQQFTAGFVPPLYIFANAHAGISGPLTIRFNNTPAITGPTGPPNSLINYGYNSSVELDTSTGNFVINNVSDAAYIYSLTPVNGPFTLTFSYLNPGGFPFNSSPPKAPIFGVSTNVNVSTGANNVTHGVNGYAEANATGHIIYTNNIESSRVGGPPPTYAPYELRYDGRYIFHYVNGVPVSSVGMPLENTVAQPWYIFFHLPANSQTINPNFAGNSRPRINIKYVPLLTGPVGPTGPSLPKTISSVYQFSLSSSVTSYTTTGIKYKLANPNTMSISATPNTGAYSALTIVPSMSTQSLPATTYLSDYLTNNGDFKNIYSSPLNIQITILPAANPPATYSNLQMYLVITNTVTNVPFTTPTMSAAGFNYSFILNANSYFNICIIHTTPSLPPGFSYYVNLVQTPITAGGARIVDVAPSLKPKLRKSSIRVKKAKKQTKKQK